MGNMEKGLIERIKEKPAKAAVKTYVGIEFILKALQTAGETGKGIYDNSQDYIDIVGKVGYLASQVALPVLVGVSFGLLGYVATKGSGMFMDKYWYDENKSQGTQ